MRFSYHPDFPKEIKKFQAQYSEISERLAIRFRVEVENAIERIKASPSSAGHFLNAGSKIVKEVRRRGVSNDLLVFRSIIPSGSDPLTWLVSHQTGRQNRRADVFVK